MDPVNFEDPQWHVQATKAIVEVRQVQSPPNDLYVIFVRGKAVTSELTHDDQRVLVAKMIESSIPGSLTAVASQAFHFCGQIVHQQQQAAATISQQASQAADSLVAELTAALGTDNG